MPKSAIELIETHKESVSICDAEEAVRRVAENADVVLIDVREPAEFESGAVASATNIPRGFLEFRISEVCSADDHPVLVHCKSGGRAVLAAKTLNEMGYSNVTVIGGDVEDLIAAFDRT